MNLVKINKTKVTLRSAYILIKKYSIAREGVWYLLSFISVPLPPHMIAPVQVCFWKNKYRL